MRVGRWKGDIASAKAAAARAGFGHVDDSGTVFLDVFTTIESRPTP